MCCNTFPRFTVPFHILSALQGQEHRIVKELRALSCKFRNGAATAPTDVAPSFSSIFHKGFIEMNTGRIEWQMLFNNKAGDSKWTFQTKFNNKEGIKLYFNFASGAKFIVLQH